MEHEYEAIFYDLPDGSEPAAEFINSQPNKMAAKILWTIDLLETYGTTLRMPYSKHLDDGIFELRMQVARILQELCIFLSWESRRY